MKKVLFIACLSLSIVAVQAQGLKGLIKTVTKDTTLAKIIPQKPSTGLSNTDIITGLKEALSVGTNNSASKLSAVDGFFKDAALKILMPAEAVKVEAKLRALGMGKQVDNAILSMNRAAEDAAKSAAPIFLNAIKGITIQDGLGILQGGDFAATNFLKQKTVTDLTNAFRPVIEGSLKKVNATKYWTTLFTTYNAFSKEKVNTDLNAYVTEKALTGIFLQVSLEEQKIRKDPLARTTDILKKVFAK